MSPILPYPPLHRLLLKARTLCYLCDSIQKTLLGVGVWVISDHSGQRTLFMNLKSEVMCFSFLSRKVGRRKKKKKAFLEFA